MAGPHPVIGTGTDWFGSKVTRRPQSLHARCLRPEVCWGLAKEYSCRIPTAPVINHHPEHTVPRLFEPRGWVLTSPTLSARALARQRNRDWALPGNVELIWVPGVAPQMRRCTCPRSESRLMSPPRAPCHLPVHQHTTRANAPRSSPLLNRSGIRLRFGTQRSRRGTRAATDGLLFTRVDIMRCLRGGAPCFVAHV